jgi:hypothetical protein
MSSTVLFMRASTTVGQLLKKLVLGVHDHWYEMQLTAPQHQGLNRTGTRQTRRAGVVAKAQVGTAPPPPPAWPARCVPPEVTQRSEPKVGIGAGF